MQGGQVFTTLVAVWLIDRYIHLINSRFKKYCLELQDIKTNWNSRRSTETGDLYQLLAFILYSLFDHRRRFIAIIDLFDKDITWDIINYWWHRDGSAYKNKERNVFMRGNQPIISVLTVVFLATYHVKTNIIIMIRCVFSWPCWCWLLDCFCFLWGIIEYAVNILTRVHISTHKLLSTFQHKTLSIIQLKFSLVFQTQSAFQLHGHTSTRHFVYISH